jgi:hypothetical protein
VPTSRLISIPSFLTFLRVLRILRFLTRIVAIHIATLRTSPFRQSLLPVCGHLPWFYCPDSPFMNAPPSASAAEPPSATQQQCSTLAETAAGAGQQRQQAPLTEMRLHSPWRRLACDRCRLQKLRCVRTKENDTSRLCTRCLRIGHPCFTSSAKLPGRSFGRLPLAPEPTASSAGLATSANPSNKRKAIRRRAGEQDSLAAGQNSHMSMGWPFIHDEHQNEEARMFFGNIEQSSKKH